MRKTLPRLLTILLAVLVQPHAVVADYMTPVQISRQVVYHERIVMPPGTTIRVTLEDVSRADVRAVVLGEQIITPDSGVPVAFTLQYDAAKIDPRFSYAPRAQIRNAQGKLLWAITTHSGVLARGFPSDDIQLVVEPVARETRRVSRTAVFDCSGLEIIVRYGLGEAAIWLPARYTVVSQVRAASGARYEGDGILFWNKGDEAMLEVDGVRYQNCKRNPQRGNPGPTQSDVGWISAPWAMNHPGNWKLARAGTCR